MQNQSTINDVAKAAGVSIGTVDRVLHNRGRVSEKNKAEVLKAVAALDYRPSQIARALATSRSRIRIGITYPNVDNAFWSEIEAGIEQASQQLQPFGVELLVRYTNTYSIRDQLDAIDELIAAEVNGIIFTAVDDNSADSIELHIPPEVPYVTVINSNFSSRRAFHVGPDDFALGALAARLASLYCQPQCDVIVIAPNVDVSGTQQRIAGFVSKVKQEIKSMNIIRVCSVPGATEDAICKNVYELTLESISKHPSLNAVYVTNGFFEWAAAAVKDSTRSNLKVIGHEYTKSLPAYIREGIVAATIYQHPARQWYVAIHALFELLTQKGPAEKSDILIECSIIMKETLPMIKIGELGLF